MSDEKNNSGNYNSGDCNSGDSNSGNYNSGDCNSGYYNSGDSNSGNCNSGCRNSGNCNSGYYNSGDYNSGDYNSGFFCTENAPVSFFDAPYGGSREDAEKLIPSIDLPVCCVWIPEAKMTEKEKAEYPNHKTIGGYLKSNPLPLTESFPLAWANMSEGERLRWKSLPNFDAEKFLKITGVDVRVTTITQKKPKQIILDGITYNLIPA